ncbi:MAG: DUF5690 family protein [Verrucomicrobiota bacterium]
MASPTSLRVSRFSAWLERAPAPVFVGFAIAAAFATYFAMYAFRKPFAAASFEGQFFFGTEITLKSAIVISQVVGYALSKLIGIKVCSEVTPARRAGLLLLLIGIAQAALVLYALLPGGWKIVAIFLNGLPLGMVWGLVVWYLEGRRTSELLLMGLSLSFIVSSGAVKDFGRALMNGGIAETWRQLPLIGAPIGAALGRVNESWMPAVAGFHFLPVFLLAVWLLNQLPRPSAADIELRAARRPMPGADRLAFLRQFAFGLALLCVAYFFLTAYRDFRDNYQVELFDALGYRYADNKTIISRAETIVTLGVMAILALLYFVRDNRRGLRCTFGIMTSGVLLLGVSTILLHTGVMSGFWWMTCTGLGSYLCYVPYGSVLFDRLIASTRVSGTAVFAIYVADTIGYIGSIGSLLFKDLVAGSMSRLTFFTGFTWLLCGVGLVCLVSSAIYFDRRVRDFADARSRAPFPPAVAPLPATST